MFIDGKFSSISKLNFNMNTSKMICDHQKEPGDKRSCQSTNTNYVDLQIKLRKLLFTSVFLCQSTLLLVQFGLLTNVKPWFLKGTTYWFFFKKIEGNYALAFIYFSHKEHYLSGEVLFAVVLTFVHVLLPAVSGRWPRTITFRLIKEIHNFA